MHSRTSNSVKKIVFTAFDARLCTSNRVKVIFSVLHDFNFPRFFHQALKRRRVLPHFARLGLRDMCGSSVVSEVKQSDTARAIGGGSGGGRRVHTK